MSAEPSMPFGALLRRYREAAGLSQEDLAERAGLTEKGIGALERGERQRPQPRTLQQLVSALKLSDHERAAFIAAVPRRAGVGPDLTVAPPAPGPAMPDAGVADALLATKLTMPSPRPALVPRPRLIERLQAGLRGPFTLLSAPAGSGKTTLLGAWRATAEGGSVPMAWVSLDAGDDDPSRFWGYVCTALETVRPGVAQSALSMLQSPQTPPPEVLLPGVLNAFAAVSTDHILVLDDYHVIEAPAIHRGLAFLLDHMPPCLHLLVASRADPPFSLARLRARGTVVELREADLRCTLDEATTMLTQVMGVPLSAEQVGALAHRTEGWMAGLQLAALSLQGRQIEAIEQFIAAFSGSNRFVVDYLGDEVLNQQPQEVQEFLAHSAVLDRLCAGLCDAVMAESGADRRDSQAMLEHLDRANLFVIALDDERQWYRYHHLFVDVLRHRLQRNRPDLLPALHRRACAWYERQGLKAEAIEHALAGGDFERAVDLMEVVAPPMSVRGQAQTVLRWLSALPDSALEAHPYLCAGLGTALLLSDRIPAVEHRLQQAERAVHDGMPIEQQRLVLGTVVGIRAAMASYVGDLAAGRVYGQQALDLSLEHQLLIRCAGLSALAHAFMVTGDTTHGVEEAIARAAEAARRGGNRLVMVRMLLLEPQLRVAQGRLRQAMALYERATQHLPHPGALQFTPCGPAYYVGVGDLLREHNRLDDAEAPLKQGMSMFARELIVEADIVVRGYIAYARVLHARGQGPEALALLDQLVRLVQDRQYATHLIARASSARAQLQLARGDLAAAARWAASSGLRADDEPGYPREAEYLTFARVCIAQAREAGPQASVGEALRLLDHLLAAAETGERWGGVIEIQILRALALQAMSLEAAALTAFARALDLAEPEGYVRIFVDEGQPMAALLCQAQARGIASGYVASLLAALGVQEQRRGPPSSLQVTAGPDLTRPLAEPLSERERAVLRLLAAGLSGPEIGRQLYVEVSTVKTHLKSIYGKLEVHSREQAVARARALHLLGD